MGAAVTVAPQQVEAWNLERLIDLGFSLRQAGTLISYNVIWWDAKALVERGCPHEIAVKLLKPL